MYSTCIFCGDSLGQNEVVEVFPVGRRLAFDPERGRLWVLCPHCRQWNLSPLEERWEALEALERMHRDTTTRYSTEEIGLSRHREGLEMVRIGRPTLPEYAAWRYGTQLTRRRKRAFLATGASVAGATALIVSTNAGLIAAGAGLAGIHAVNLTRGLYGAVRTVARIELPDGSRAQLKERHAKAAHMTAQGGAWELHFRHVIDQPTSRLQRLRWAAGSIRQSQDPLTTLDGAAAVRAAGKILPVINHSGGSIRIIREATRFVEETITADEAFRRALTAGTSPWRSLTAPTFTPAGALYRLPKAVRIGLELTAHEASERRALEGELDELEREWRAAEEIAAIADDLLLPERIRALRF